MAISENRHHPDLIEIMVAHKKGADIDPCRKGCQKTLETCGIDDGLSYDPDTGGAICLIKRTPVVIFASPPVQYRKGRPNWIVCRLNTLKDHLFQKPSR